MPDIIKGETFSGVSPGNEVTPVRMNNLVDVAFIHTSFLTSKPEELLVDDADYVLFYDSSANAWKKVKKSNLIPAASSLMSGFRGLTIKNRTSAPTFQLDVTADEITMREPGGNMRRALNLAQTVDITVYAAPASVNGRDFATENASTWYYVWGISDGINDRLLLSASQVTPTMPTGYSYKCLLGAARNNAASDFIRFQQNGCDVTCEDLIPQAHSVDFTAITPSGAGIFETVDLARCVPPNIAGKVSGYLGTPTITTNLRAIVASSAAGTDAAPTAGTVYGWTPIALATSGVVIGGLAGAGSFLLPIRTSQTLSWTSQGAATQTMRINGYSLNFEG